MYFPELTGRALGTFLLLLSIMGLILLAEPVLFLLPILSGILFLYLHYRTPERADHPLIIQEVRRFYFVGTVFASILVVVMYIFYSLQFNLWSAPVLWIPYLANSIVFVALMSAVAGYVYGDSKRTRKKYEKLSTELEQKNEQTELFAGAISHDLRNPLSVVNGYIDLIKADVDGKDDEFEKVDNALTRMENIIEDSLALARGDDRLSEEEAHIQDLVREAWTQAETEGLEIEVNGETQVRCDPSYTKQVFENIFRNINDHADASAVTVDITNEEVVIEDNGVGFSDNLLGQLDYTDDSLGLGLSVVGFISYEQNWTTYIENTETGGCVRIEL